MEDLRNRVEAVLFSVGKKIDVEEIAKLCRADINEVIKILKQLQKEYTEKDSALVILDEGTKWSLTVREKYLSLTKKLVADTELSKTMMETLAVIAWKQPIKQSEVISIRTNKAYDHIKELEEMGFITSEKYGRTKLLKLTEKFFNYFEVSGDMDIRKIFKGVKETDEETVKLKQKKEQKQEEKETSIEEVQTYGEKEIEEEKETEKLAGLEVYKESKEQSIETDKEITETEKPKKEKEELEEDEKQETEETTTDELIDEELNK